MAQESLNDEIKWLEERLSAKKTELLESGESKAEKEVVKDILKETALLPPPPNLQTTPLPCDDVVKKAQELEEKEHSQIVETLVADALKNGVIQAINIAEKMKNPHILDDFHDTLADKYYQKLLESRNIKQ